MSTATKQKLLKEALKNHLDVDTKTIDRLVLHMGRKVDCPTWADPLSAVIYTTIADTENDKPTTHASIMNELKYYINALQQARTNIELLGLKD